MLIKYLDLEIYCKGLFKTCHHRWINQMDVKSCECILYADPMARQFYLSVPVRVCT